MPTYGEQSIPAKTPDPDAYDTWFHAKVQEALDDQRPATSQARAMELLQVALDVADMPEELGNCWTKGSMSIFTANLPTRTISPNLDYLPSVVYTSV